MHFFHSERYAKHRAMIQTTRLQNLLADRLVEGQRVYVSGGIGYAEFQNAEGQRRQYGFIHTNELYRCKEVEGGKFNIFSCSSQNCL